MALEGGVACETDFADCGEDAECDVEIAGAKVPLQRVSVTLPPDVADVGGLTFVLRRCGCVSLLVALVQCSGRSRRCCLECLLVGALA